LTSWKEEDDHTDRDYILCLPPRIQAGAARSSEIRLRADQLRVIDYWAQAGQEALVGILIFVNNQQIEYWLKTQIDPIQVSHWNPICRRSRLNGSMNQ
jgi:hypothetical protein